MKTHWTTCVLLALFVFASGCGTSPRIVVNSQQPGATGAIVFTSSRAVDGSDAGNPATNIWVTNPDGSGTRALAALTAAGASSASPAWSPGGAKIAFESFRALDGSNASIPAVNIWAMNADGSGLTALTSLTAQSVNSLHSAWSPDGNRIAFDSTRVLDGSNAIGTVVNIWVMNADGSNAKPFTLLTASMASSVSPAWSPSGSKIAYLSSRALNGTNASIGVRNIWTMNPDGSNSQPLTTLTVASCSDFAWSPDGKRIAFVSTRALDGSDTLNTAANIWVMNADGSGATPLTRFTTLYNLTVQTPVWSPDGARIAYASSRALDGSDTGGSVLNIWVMNADGSGQRALTAQVAATNYQPSWSSDGSRIVFCSSRALNGSDASNSNGTENVWVMNNDGSGLRILTTATAFGADSAGPQWMR